MPLDKEAARVYAALEMSGALRLTERFVASIELPEKEQNEEANVYDTAINEELLALLEYFIANEQLRSGK